MRPTVGDLISIMEIIAPVCWAEVWDNAGLQVGEASAAAGRILLALEITDADR